MAGIKLFGNGEKGAHGARHFGSQQAGDERLDFRS